MATVNELEASECGCPRTETVRKSATQTHFAHVEGCKVLAKEQKEAERAEKPAERVARSSRSTFTPPTRKRTRKAG